MRFGACKESNIAILNNRQQPQRVCKQCKW
jgi:hypothetical protein